jgi:2-phosphoglycerate kinase
MIYLIGGPARCGKSTLAKKVRQHIDGQVVSLDGMMTAFQQVASPDAYPDLFTKLVDTVTVDGPIDARVARYKRRDVQVWRLMAAYMSMLETSGDNLLVEGVIWPDLLHELSQAHRAVFLVDTSKQHIERLVHIRDTASDNNWMKDDYSDNDKMAKWAAFNVARSQETIRLCNKYGYRYFDIADHGIDGAQQKAYDYLLAG